MPTTAKPYCNTPLEITCPKVPRSGDFWHFSWHGMLSPHFSRHETLSPARGVRNHTPISIGSLQPADFSLDPFDLVFKTCHYSIETRPKPATTGVAVDFRASIILCLS